MENYFFKAFLKHFVQINVLMCLSRSFHIADAISNHLELDRNVKNICPSDLQLKKENILLSFLL